MFGEGAGRDMDGEFVGSGLSEAGVMIWEVAVTVGGPGNSFVEFREFEFFVLGMTLKSCL